MSEEVRKSVPSTQPTRSANREKDVVDAASGPEGAIPTIVEQLESNAIPSDIPEAEKQVLQQIAHGGEGYGNSYGSGPAAPDLDPPDPHAEMTEGDSASPAASALSTRKTFQRK